MEIVVESISKNTAFSSESCTIDKPTGLEVGDVMVAVINGVTTAGTINTLSGWTSAINYGAGGTRSISVQYKIAEASDVSASNFTFTATGFTHVTGGILRTTGIVTDSDFIIAQGETKNSANTATPSFTVSAEPFVTNSLVIMAMIGINGSFGNVSGYASTPSATYTELFDVTLDYGTDDPTSACAYGLYSGVDTITAYTATSSYKNDWFGVFVLFTPIVDATGTNALLEVSPTHLAQAGVAGVVGTNALLEVTQDEIPEQSGTATTPTQWANESKPTTDWTNETL